METINTLSIYVGLAAYVLFVGFCVVCWIRGVTGRALFTAAALSLAWLVSHSLTGPSAWSAALEHALLLGWIFLLARALGLERARLFEARFRPVTYTFGAVLAVGAVGMIGSLALTAQSALLGHVTLLLLNVLGMVAIEQMAKNTRSDSRWRTRYLSIGLGTLFVYGIALHSTAMLFGMRIPALYVLQPAILAFVVPFMVIGSLRNRANRLRFNLKRNFVFQTGVLVGTGIFLLLLGVFGYIAQLFAGDVGATVAVFAATVGIAGLLVVLGSSRTRRHLRVILAKTFFEYRYDYRDEWMRITKRLTEPDADFDLSQQAQRALQEVLHATRSALWIKHNGRRFVPASQVEASDWLQPLPSDLAGAIVEFYADRDWVLHLTSMPDEASNLHAALDALPFREQVHFLVPLFVEDELFGVVLLGKPAMAVDLVWEDFDIIKLVSRQCAGFLALEQANQSLRESDQLSAMNQMSAFLIHDIKTITAQLSLMIENAARHRDNPAFIDDMLRTTENSVQRMQKILASLQRPQAAPKETEATLELKALVDEAVDKLSRSGGQLSVVAAKPVHVRADKEQLASAINHLTQNAVEAVNAVGHVDICINDDGNWAEIEIKDDGPGMSRDYIENELFTPFKTSKGVSGMGIGAYQARVYVRSLGGDITVSSALDQGSTFNIKIPLAASEATA